MMPCVAFWNVLDLNQSIDGDFNHNGDFIIGQVCRGIEIGFLRLEVDQVLLNDLNNIDICKAKEMTPT